MDRDPEVLAWVYGGRRDTSQCHYGKRVVLRLRYRRRGPGMGFRDMRPGVEDERDNAYAENKG